VIPMSDMSKQAEQKIEQLQMMEQNLRTFSTQRQQFSSQLLEVESALKEIEGSEEAYKIVGGIMVATKKEDLKKDLKEKKEILELRITSIEKQEEKIKEKASSTQKEVLKEMENK
jgi:prefoldin beta subunit